VAKVLVVGCGDLGTAIAENLQKNHQVIGLRRNIHAPAGHAFLGGIKTIQADVTLPDSLVQLENLKPNVIVYCISAGGQTDEQYQAAYVTGLKNVMATQANNQALQHVFFVSSTRVYGQTHGQNNAEILDENSAAIPADFGGERLLEAESFIKKQACKSTSMRLSGIYGSDRLYLVNMAKDASKWPVENHWSNRIHRDDAAAFIALMVEKSLKNQLVADCYIVTDDMPTQQYEVLTWLAKQQDVDTSNVKTPAAQGGKRLSNARMRGTGFELKFPNYQAGYGEVLKAI
jgi:nucleoside-diphosphate-sugar epimerase